MCGHGNEYPKSASGKKGVCLVCGAESNSGSAWGVYGYVGARGTKPNLRGSTMQSLCCGGSLADLNACISSLPCFREILFGVGARQQRIQSTSRRLKEVYGPSPYIPYLDGDSEIIDPGLSAPASVCQFFILP